MAARTVLHVGTMKSGTTHVQHRLWANREQLLAQGVLVPGVERRSHVHAVRDLVALQRDQPSPFPGAWDSLVREVAAHDGTAVVSMELLASTGPRVVRRVQADLPRAEVLVTARDVNRNLPAMWQTSLRNGFTWDWPEYLAGAEATRPGRPRDEGSGPDHFWRRQHLLGVLRRWQGSGVATLVTLPPPGTSRELLWERVAGLLGVRTPPGGWQEAPADNASLGLASCRLLLRLNRELDRLGADWQTGIHVRKGFLTNLVLPSRRAEEPALGLPVPPWVEEHADRLLARLGALEASGDLRLVGHREELRPVEVPGVPLAEVAAEDVLAAAVHALAAMVERETTPGT